jgi:hypothetical protein
MKLEYEMRAGGDICTRSHRKDGDAPTVKQKSGDILNEKFLLGS